MIESGSKGIGVDTTVPAKTELQRREQGIRSWIEHRVLSPSNVSEVVNVKGAFADFPVRERADLLYGKLMEYSLTTNIIRQEKHEHPESTPEPVDPYLLGEIRALWQDQQTQDLFVSRYSEARVDAKLQRLATLGRKWKEVNETIDATRDVFGQETRRLFLQHATRPDQISASRGRTQRLARELIRLRHERDDILHLREENGGQKVELPHTAEHTDVASAIMFEQMSAYHDEAKRGFVWLPSREAIHQETVETLQNGRWPLLLGEAGTGKSDQADAAAVALTGEQPTHLACGPNTSERQLIADKDIDPEGGSYETYGAAMQAATGYIDSRQTEPSFKTGRVARFDESGRLGEKGYSEIKELRQKRPATREDRERVKRGETIEQAKMLHGKPVLPGFAAILTTNPAGPRYPDRSEPDPALRREIAPIKVDYPPMTPENPELYEFMLATLMDDNHHIAVAREELAPAYMREPLTQEVILPDGRRVVAENKLVQSPTYLRHGALYRLSFAIRELQNAFNYGNIDTIPQTALRYSTDSSTGKLKVVGQGGDPLTLSSSTITLGEVASWMEGFRDRREKDDPDYQVNTLTEWTQLKLQRYLNQADASDREKIQALFDHFHLFDPVMQLAHAQPMIPKEIGYLSPRVPRPVELADSDKLDHRTEGKQVALRVPERKLYQDMQCILEDGTSILARLEPLLFAKEGKNIRLKQGSRFILDGERFQFVGYAPNGGLIARVDTGRRDEALHRLIDVTQLEEQGEFNTQLEEAKERFGEDFFGEEQVEKAFGITLAPEDVPDIPFEQAELEKAKELGQMLVLRVDRAADGTPLTMQKMQELLQPQFDTAGSGKVLYNTDWYKGEDFFTKETPQLSWALVGKQVLPDSTSKNYLQQTELIAEYLTKKVFVGGAIPQEYQAALDEFSRRKTAIQGLMTSDWQEAARQLAELQLNQLTRQKPVDGLYDMLLQDQNKEASDKRLLEDKYTWTNRRASDGDLVCLGGFGSHGASVGGDQPDDSGAILGVVFSRHL